MRNFKAMQLVQQRVERERKRRDREEQRELERKALEELQERRRLELLNNPLAAKVFMGLDNWRYD